jgi:GntR family transcriptional repressor for pyruvate dehydrogenase complex
MEFAKIKPQRISDAIARQLETMILEGVLKPGEKLPPERELAHQFSVSRPSLREALQKLENVGYLESRHGGGTFVRNVVASTLTEPLVDLLARHPQAAMDFIELRSTLEGMSAYYAAERGTAEDRAMLARRFAAMEEAHNTPELAGKEEDERDADFHIAIAEASHNVILLHVMRSLLGMIRKDVVFNRAQLYSESGARDSLLEQHRAVFQAIMARDPDGARDAAQTHMGHVARVLRAAQEDEGRAEVARLRLSRYEAESHTTAGADSGQR